MLTYHYMFWLQKLHVNYHSVFRDYTFKITNTSPRGPWVNIAALRLTKPYNNSYLLWHDFVVLLWLYNQFVEHSWAWFTKCTSHSSLFEENLTFNGGLIHEGPIMVSFSVFLFVTLDKLSNKHWSGWWFDMPWCSCGVTVMISNSPDGLWYDTHNSTYYCFIMPGNHAFEFCLILCCRGPCHFLFDCFTWSSQCCLSNWISWTKGYMLVWILMW